MTEEIKEILDDMKSIPSDEICGLGLGEKQCKLLLNYITNLQKENQSLKNQLDFIDEQNKHIDKLEKMIKDYKQRNEKAVEYIKEHTDKVIITRIPKIDFDYNELLNILKGGDE